MLLLDISTNMIHQIISDEYKDNYETGRTDAKGQQKNCKDFQGSGSQQHSPIIYLDHLPNVWRTTQKTWGVLSKQSWSLYSTTPSSVSMVSITHFSLLHPHSMINSAVEAHVAWTKLNTSTMKTVRNTGKHPVFPSVLPSTHPQKRSLTLTLSV